LIVSEKHDLPLVSFTITFLGGSNQFDSPDRTGIGSVVASMMSEGTKTRDGDAPQSVDKGSEATGSGIRVSKFGKTWGRDHLMIRFWWLPTSW
jgi:predicted Zn-dependent peptidase